jgi:tripartite-type tricarboxylate transporter receptor subunit TctC
MERRRRLAASLSAALAVTLLLPARAAEAQAEDRFYGGQQIRVIVASGPAGGFDTYARLLARHMGRFIPGAPTFIVQNMPGAGGIRAASYLAKVAPKDGLTIAATQAHTIKAPILTPAVADFDATKFGWIGSLNSEVMVCVAWHTSPIKSLKDVMSSELIVGATAGADTEFIPIALNRLLGTKFKPVVGYADGPTILVAMQRGEVAGRCGWSWSSILVQHPDWVQNKTINVLVQVPTRHATLTDVPLASDLVKDDNNKGVIEFLFGHLAMSRAYALPPGVPPARLATLRTAFDGMVKDPEFIADLKRLKQELSPMSGQQVEAVVNATLKTPPAVVERAKAAIEVKR